MSLILAVREVLQHAEDFETVDRDWDGPDVEASISNDVEANTLEQFYAWRDEDLDEDTKNAYSFLHHHNENDEAGPANLTACITGIGVLNGARIDGDPEDQDWGDDREGIHEHLAEHIREFGEEPPELSAASEEPIRGIIRAPARRVGEPNDDAPVQTREAAPKTAAQTGGIQRSPVRKPGENPGENGAIERRYYPLTSIEARQNDDEPDEIEGTAAVFDEETVIRGVFGNFKEVVRESAFDESLDKEFDVRMLFNHDRNFVFGRTGANTLELEKTDRGLVYRNTPPDSQWARDFMVSVKRGDIAESSFGFSVLDDNWTEAEDGMPLRELLSVRLFDVSPVTFPAYDVTDVEVNSALSRAGGIPDFDLRRLGDLLVRIERGDPSDDVLEELDRYIERLREKTRTPRDKQTNKPDRWLRHRKQQSRISEV